MASSGFDPLKIIFDKHLYEIKYATKEGFCELVINDYLNYLRFSGAMVGLHMEEIIIDEVKQEVHERLGQILNQHNSLKLYLKSLDEYKNCLHTAQKKYFEMF